MSSHKWEPHTTGKCAKYWVGLQVSTVWETMRCNWLSKRPILLHLRSNHSLSGMRAARRRLCSQPDCEAFCHPEQFLRASWIDPLRPFGWSPKCALLRLTHPFLAVRMRNGDFDKPNYNSLFYAESWEMEPMSFLESGGHHTTTIRSTGATLLICSKAVACQLLHVESNTLGHFEA
jgi:hypothetical protein